MLRISCASSWFFFTQLYRDAQSTKHKEIFLVSYQCFFRYATIAVESSHCLLSCCLNSIYVMQMHTTFRLLAAGQLACTQKAPCSIPTNAACVKIKL
jgi:hypothetical protein